METPPLLNDNHSSDKQLVVSDAPVHQKPSPSPKQRSQSPKSQTPPPLPPPPIANDDKSNHRESNIKLKRCKHGRIIIKDLSKKKLVQQSDSIANDTSHTLQDEHIHKQKATSHMSSRQLPPITQNHSSQQQKPVVPKLSPKAAQSEAGPLSARSPATPDNDDSASSDIYDPEGPIIAMSPVDSPPISPIDDSDSRKRVSFHPNNHDMNGDDDVPSSAVQLNRQEKYLQKLNRQERVIEEVKIALKPFYQNRSIDKEQYKDVLRRAVPKICHSKNGEINPIKIRSLVSAYVRKMR